MKDLYDYVDIFAFEEGRFPTVTDAQKYYGLNEIEMISKIIESRFIIDKDLRIVGMGLV